MSAFRVGDRVTWQGQHGTVTGATETHTDVEYDNGSLGSHHGGSLRLATTPTLETATGSDLDRIARDMLKVYRVPGTTDESFRADLLEIASSGAKVEAGPVLGVTGGRRYPPTFADLRIMAEEARVFMGVDPAAGPDWSTVNAFYVGPTAQDINELLQARADLLAARDEYRAKDAALDTVRKFLGEASFASCSLADQRRAREVMGVVLRALNAERGDTW